MIGISILASFEILMAVISKISQVLLSWQEEDVLVTFTP